MCRSCRSRFSDLTSSLMLVIFQLYDDAQYVKRSNAELINGLIGMDLGKLSAVGKR